VLLFYFLFYSIKNYSHKQITKQKIGYENEKEKDDALRLSSCLGILLGRVKKYEERIREISRLENCRFGSKLRIIKGLRKKQITNLINFVHSNQTAL